jgi:hypothetical protein
MRGQNEEWENENGWRWISDEAENQISTVATVVQRLYNVQRFNSIDLITLQR